MGKIIKPRPLSGFPEWSPELRAAEQQMLDGIRRKFELYGYASIETPVVERLEVLLSKGADTDKEMYVLERLGSQGEKETEDARLGLHYDLTVPFARYVAAHFNELVFPFKRYQMQYAWRGERPQEGRFRQFMQCDIDVVAVDNLPLAFDADIPLAAAEVLESIGFGKFTFKLSNRKILKGYLEALGITEALPVLRLLDKIDKIGREEVEKLLVKECSLSNDLAARCMAIASITSRDTSFKEEVNALGVSSDLMQQGLDELEFVLTTASAGKAEHPFMVDLSVTRGFDYYTGSVYEVIWDEFPSLGVICGGGRYDDLAGAYINKHIPGVGISIGFTRIFSKLVKEGRVVGKRPVPTEVLVTWLEGDDYRKISEIAHNLRDRGIATEVFHSPVALKKQLQYASRRGIPYVFFAPDGEIKDMQSGEQYKVDINSWSPKSEL